ncbi:MAG: indolepyruvate oxidoreductase subunit beta [Bacteroidales bacterium]|nr:indolepyruvate oxidoreductase subunit beta [Bacteroidales bacterium]MDD5978272.1 indolepyruvate oxidoreductase subunit beta [Bacteroidales bacterium]MDD7276961.1 indolepyruvate oxidoreductase subunit beta [Bacteroidales bacterium]MDY6075444.1 indolepyruvate oxidoreductase subunit beta [Bacteroidales bacterium]
MKKDIILAGVGGQGILSIASCIGIAAVEENLYLKQAEVHGMSQRGGDVQSHLRLSSNEIASDLIPEGKADMIISVEPMEALRYLPMLSKNGVIITASEPFINIDNYPEVEKVYEELKKHNAIIVDADTIAKECGNIRAANMVIFGAAVPSLEIDMQTIENSIRKQFGSKGEEVVELNLKAVKAGFEQATKR